MNNKIIYGILLVLLSLSITYNIMLRREAQNLEEARYWISGSEYEKIKKEIYRLDQNNDKYLLHNKEKN
jgi:hypothetical protein